MPLPCRPLSPFDHTPTPATLSSVDSCQHDPLKTVDSLAARCATGSARFLSADPLVPPCQRALAMGRQISQSRRRRPGPLLRHIFGSDASRLRDPVSSRHRSPLRSQQRPVKQGSQEPLSVRLGSASLLDRNVLGILDLGIGCCCFVKARCRSGSLRPTARRASQSSNPRVWSSRNWRRRGLATMPAADLLRGMSTYVALPIEN